MRPTYIQAKIRMPEDVHAMLVAAAEVNKRSLTAEVIARCSEGKTNADIISAVREAVRMEMRADPEARRDWLNVSSSPRLSA